MPRYRIKLPNGRIHEINASRELTQQELVQVVDLLSKQQPAPAFDLGSLSLWAQQLPPQQPTLAQLLAPRPQPKPPRQPKPTIWSQPQTTPIRDEPLPQPDVANYSAFSDWKPLTPEQLAENARLVAEAQRQAEQSTGGLLSGFLEVLNIPLAAAAAAVGASVTRGGEWFGREAGQPRQVAKGDWARRFWSLYSPDLEWGAVLEAAAPGLPRLARQLLAIPADIILDPLNVATPARVAGAGGKLARRVPKLAELLEAANDLARRGQYAVLRQLHPTAAAAVEGVVRRYGRQGESLWDVAKRRPWNPVTLTPDAGGVFRREQAPGPRDLLALLREALASARSETGEEAISSELLKILGLPPEALRRLPTAVRERIAAEQHRKILDLLPMARTISEGRPERDINWLIGVVRDLLDQAAAEQLALADPADAGRLAEFLRRLGQRQTEPSLWERILGHWKRVRTVGNFPAGAVRNFLGNFLANYLAGEPLKLSKRQLKELIAEAFQQGATRAADIGVNVNPGRGPFTRFYTGADKLAAGILSKLTGKPPEYFLIGEDFALPETLDKLSRWGLIPFASWPTWIAPRLARGLWEKPARYAQLGRLLRAIGVREQDTNVYLPAGPEDEFGVQRKAINLDPILPLSPYQFLPVSTGGEPPEWYSNWALPALYRQIYEAWSGGNASPAGLTTPSPELNAAITLATGISPPSLLNLLRLAAPQLFADRQELGRPDYLLRLLGAPIVTNPELWQPIKQRAERREERKRMRRQRQRERQLAGEE